MSQKTLPMFYPAEAVYLKEERRRCTDSPYNTFTGNSFDKLKRLVKSWFKVSLWEFRSAGINRMVRGLKSEIRDSADMGWWMQQRRKGRAYLIRCFMVVLWCSPDETGYSLGRYSSRTEPRPSLSLCSHHTTECLAHSGQSVIICGSERNFYEKVLTLSLYCPRGRALYC